MNRYKGLFTFDTDTHRYVPIGPVDEIVVEDDTDYATTEPLIKDPTIRKAVRAWAEVNGDTRFYYNRPTIEICINDKAGYVIRSIKFKPEFRESIDIKSGYYTIAELCGDGKGENNAYSTRQAES